MVAATVCTKWRAETDCPKAFPRHPTNYRQHLSPPPHRQEARISLLLPQGSYRWGGTGRWRPGRQSKGGVRKGMVRGKWLCGVTSERKRSGSCCYCQIKGFCRPKKKKKKKNEIRKKGFCRPKKKKKKKKKKTRLGKKVFVVKKKNEIRKKGFCRPKKKKKKKKKIKKRLSRWNCYNERQAYELDQFFSEKESKWTSADQ